jgi:hypothetical protein
MTSRLTDPWQPSSASCSFPLRIWLVRCRRPSRRTAGHSWFGSGRPALRSLGDARPPDSWFAWSSSWLARHMRRAVAGIRHDWSARTGCPGVVPCRSRARRRRRTRRRRRNHPGERAPRAKRPDCSLAHSDDGDRNWVRHGCGRRALLLSGWWRIAFLLALPLGFIGAQLCRRIAETPQFEAPRTDSRLADHRLVNSGLITPTTPHSEQPPAAPTQGGFSQRF